MWFSLVVTGAETTTYQPCNNGEAVELQSHRDYDTVTTDGQKHPLSKVVLLNTRQGSVMISVVRASSWVVYRIMDSFASRRDDFSQLCYMLLSDLDTLSIEAAPLPPLSKPATYVGDRGTKYNLYSNYSRQHIKSRG